MIARDSLVPVVFAAGWFLAAASGAQPAPHPFSVHDLVALERLSAPRASPGGEHIAFVVRTTDLAADRGRTDIWTIGSAGNGLRRLTTHEANDSEPRFSPDGASLYFLSARSGSSQVWRLALMGGEAEQVTDLPLDVSAFVLSPDGKRLALALEVYPDCADLECTKERLGKPPAGGAAYDALLVRHWDTWKDGRRNQLFVAELGAGGKAAGKPVHASRGVSGDVPSRPFGGAEEVCFTPDSRRLVFSARVAGTAEAWSTNFDLFVAPVDGSRDAVRLTGDNPAWDTQPSFTADGRELVWLAMARPGYESDRFSFRAARLEGERLVGVRSLAADWDRSPGSYTHSRDGKSLYAVAPDLGQTSLFAVDLQGGAVRRLVGEGNVDGVVAARESIVFLHDDLRHPADLQSVALDGGDRRALTAWNADRLAAVRMGGAEQFTFTGAGGDLVHAYVVLPPGEPPPGRRVPVAFLIHGGPQGSFGNHFHYRWNPQTYAGAGYAAVMVDFHGSTGYGQAFTDAIRRDWGGAPLEDLERGLAAALARYPVLDGERVCALGASYGGYMVNWIAGQLPERFRCLVNHDGLFDLRSMYYSTEELWFPEWEMGGPYFADAEAHERWNPARFVERWRTPMLVVHGGLDDRVPDTQGLMTFTALQRRGVPSRLLYFANENHWVLRPRNSIQWHEEVQRWLARWLDAPPTGSSPTSGAGAADDAARGGVR